MEDYLCFVFCLTSMITGIENLKPMCKFMNRKIVICVPNSLKPHIDVEQFRDDLFLVLEDTT
jgi:hypothetical protein